jgi:hypothetical protein
MRSPAMVNARMLVTTQYTIRLKKIRKRDS